MHSSSTTEGPRPAAVDPGTVIAGFRVEAVLAATPEAISYRATQLSLQRQVELALHDEPGSAARVEAGALRQAVLHHPAIVAVFETGESQHGRFVARRLLGGGTLAQALAAGPPQPERLRQMLADVAAGLEAAHAAGLVHGALSAETVQLDDGRAHLVALVAPEDREAEIVADRRAFAALLEQVHQVRRVPAPLRQLHAARSVSGRRRVAALAVVVAAAAVVALRPAGEQESLAPAVPRGQVAIGSPLSPGPVSARDCEGRGPAENSPSCTLLPVAADGRPVTAPADGVVRGWAVRGARGTLAVQVVARDPDGRHREVGRSQFVQVSGDGPQRFVTELPVRRGERLALELAPGAGIGVRAAEPGLGAQQWIGPLELIRVPRAPDPSAIRDGAIQVRFDFAPGAARRRPAQLLGDAARSAPAGEVIETEEVEIAGGSVVAVSLVRLPGRLVMDLGRGGRRAARIDVAGADPEGRLVILEQGFTTRDYVRVQWRNPGGDPLVIHGYAVRSDRLELVH